MLPKLHRFRRHSRYQAPQTANVLQLARPCKYRKYSVPPASQHTEQDFRQETGNARGDETVTAEEQAEKARRRALKLWMEALPVAGTPAQTYFEQFAAFARDVGC